MIAITTDNKIYLIFNMIIAMNTIIRLSTLHTWWNMQSHRRGKRHEYLLRSRDESFIMLKGENTEKKAEDISIIDGTILLVCLL